MRDLGADLLSRFKELTRKNGLICGECFLSDKVRAGRKRHIDGDLKLIGELQY